MSSNDEENRVTGDWSAVQVAVRVRPFLPFEAGHNHCVDILSSSTNRGQKGRDIYTDTIRIGGEVRAHVDFPHSSSYVNIEIFQRTNSLSVSFLLLEWAIVHF